MTLVQGQDMILSCNQCYYSIFNSCFPWFLF